MSSERATRLKGFLIVGIGVLVLTPDALLIRLSGGDAYSLLLVRGSLTSLGLFLALSYYYRGRSLRLAIRSMGRPGLAASLLYGVGSFLFIVALEHTSVANVLVMIAVEPVFAAIIAWIWLGERIAFATGLAIAGGLAGIAIVVSDSLGSPTFLGDASALGCALLFSLFLVLLRKHRDRDMVPSVAFAGLVSAAMALAVLLSRGQGPEVLAVFTAGQWGWILLNSLFILPFSFALLAIGPRYLPPPEVGLILLLETVLGPMWVWWALAERPSDATLIGGALVVATLVLHACWQLRPRAAGAGRRIAAP